MHVRGLRALLVVLAGLAAASCGRPDRDKLGPKWTWTGRLENAARTVAVVEVEAYSYDIPRSPVATCLYVRAVYRPVAADLRRPREVVMRVTCVAGDVRRTDEAELWDHLAPPRGIMFNLFTLDPLPARPTACRFEFADRVRPVFDEEPPRDPLGVLCVENNVLREGECPGLLP